MATIGKGILQKPAFDMFDAMRSYDAKKAAAQLADDATYASPYSGGELHGKAAIEAHLATWLGNAKTRPSLTIKDVNGDGAVHRFKVSVSGRFGQAPQNVAMDVLCLQGKVHQVTMKPEGDPGH